MAWYDSLYKDKAGNFDPLRAAATVAGATALYGALKPDSKIGEFIGAGSRQQPVGYTGGIPEYQIDRSLVPNAFAATTPTGEPRRPGSGGRRYFSDTTYTPTGKVMSPAIAPVSGQSQGVYGGLSEADTIAMLNALFSGGGLGGGTAPQTTPTPAYGNIASNIRKGLTTPATSAAALNGVLPGENFTEESVVFNLLENNLATPQEVADYYKDRNYSVGDILERYNAMGGTKTFAQGGLASLPQSRGYYLGGTTDGMADRIPATIGGKEPAALSDGEFVVPADVVSHLGNGNSDAGAKQLYSMMDRIRQARTGRKEQGRKINPNTYIPG